MKIVSYYVDKIGIMYQIIRTENNIEINRINNGENKNDVLAIGELINIEIERIVELSE